MWGKEVELVFCESVIDFVNIFFWNFWGVGVVKLMRGREWWWGSLLYVGWFCFGGDGEESEGGCWGEEVVKWVSWVREKVGGGYYKSKGESCERIEYGERRREERKKMGVE